MGPFFFDTAALQHRYVQGPYSRRIRYLVSRANGSAYIADWTVLEMASALARRCRANGLGLASYDRMHDAFVRDIGSGRLQVRVTGIREALRARHLIRFAGVTRKKAIGSGDALIATCALELALELQEVVTFYTSDWGLFLSLRDWNAFRSALKLLLIGTTKDGSSPACGCLPGVTRTLGADKGGN